MAKVISDELGKGNARQASRRINASLGQAKQRNADLAVAEQEYRHAGDLGAKKSAFRRLTRKAFEQ